MSVIHKFNIFEKMYDILIILVDFCSNFLWFWLIFWQTDPDPQQWFIYSSENILKFIFISLSIPFVFCMSVHRQYMFLFSFTSSNFFDVFLYLFFTSFLLRMYVFFLRFLFYVCMYFFLRFLFYVCMYLFYSSFLRMYVFFLRFLFYVCMYFFFNVRSFTYIFLFFLRNISTLDHKTFSVL